LLKVVRIVVFAFDASAATRLPEVVTAPLLPPTVGREIFHLPEPASPAACAASASATGPEFKFVAIVGEF
jgi:hypothetical protein